MSDALLPYYDRELTAIHRLANEFAEAYPKIAGRLRLSPGGVDDPHVARLLDGVAFLAARVHHRLDDEFPELTDALPGVLYPHYLAPVPSCMVARLDCSPDLQTPDTRPVGTEFETEPVRGEALRYRTTAPVTLWPIEVENIRLTGLPLVAPANPAAAGAVAVLRITLKCMVPDMTFAQLGVDKLRFFLQGPSNQTLPLYELLGGHVLSVAFADSASDANPVIVPAQSVRPAGFGDDEALLPWSARGFAGFRLLTEYFAFPEKFLFIDINGIDKKTMATGGNRLEIFIYLDRAITELERTVGQQSLALGCVPITNLFRRRCEPISVTHMQTEYRIVPDARRPHYAEVWSIERVRETLQDGSSRPWRPFHRLTEADPDPAVPGRFLSPHAAHRGPRRRRHRGFSDAARSWFRSNRPERCDAVGRRAVPEPGFANGPALWRRATRAAAGRRRRFGGLDHAGHTADHHDAAAVARPRVLATDLASLARSSVGCGRHGRCRGVEGSAAPLCIPRHAGNDDRRSKRC